MSFSRELIQEYYKMPVNYGKMEDYSVVLEDFIPSCGDSLKVWMKLSDEDVVEKISYAGEGCVLSQATTSMLTEELQGKKLPEIEKLDKDYILGLLGIPVRPVRLKCALLGLKIIQNASLKFKSEKK